MKKLIMVAFAAASLAVIPSGAFADDIQDGADCAAATEPSVTAFDPTAADPDRGQLCVPGVLYIGGEVQAEEDGNPDAGGACGAVMVGGTTYSGDADWDNDNGTPDDPSDDNHCD